MPTKPGAKSGVPKTPAHRAAISEGLRRANARRKGVVVVGTSVVPAIEPIDEPTSAPAVDAAPPERLFLAVTAHYWGTGSTAEAAEQAMRRAGAYASHLKRYGYVVFLLPAGARDAYVTDLGSIRWTGTTDETLVEVRNTIPKQRRMA